MGKIMCVLLVFLVSPFVMANNNGLVTVKSQHDVELTANRLERILLDKGMTIFARVKHAEAAWELGKKLRPTELIIFGNPKIGTLLMQCQQTAAIDLPQKALVWADAAGTVWLSYNNPDYIESRHNIQGC
ncbi:MAG: DUF302 domain-containing protein, partial [Gammaproteobacteria bacterium]|nr:DUF302 domain-containing protein [Gammaproteobacteria bacterium]